MNNKTLQDLYNDIGQPIVYFDSIDSTNDYAKKEINNLKDKTIILSDKQTAGKGRRGNEWESSKGTGICMSLVLKPDIYPTEGTKMTQIAAAAVCKAIRDLTGLNVLIKWPNDIVINSKKVCGILTEMSGELNKIRYIVIGIGVNVNTDEFSSNLKEKATSLYIEGNKKIDRKKLIVKILDEFEELYESFIEKLNLDDTLKVIRKHSAILGKEIRIIQGKKEKRAKAIEINRQGMLVIENENGNRELISSGQVSIRGEHRYI